MKKYILLISCVVAMYGLQAQQLYNFSMVRENAFIFNPGITGVNVGSDVYVGIRKQWFNIDDSPFTGVVSGQGSFPKKVGLGGFILHDHTGPTSQTGFGISAAYHIYLGRQFYNRKVKGQTGKTLSFGVNLSMYQYRINTSEINFEQENDPIIGQDPTAFFPDAAFGIYFQSKKLYTGFSIPQIMNIDVGSTELKKVQHYMAYFGYKILNKKQNFQFEPTLWLRYAVNAPPQADIMMRFKYDDKVWFGLNYRTVNTLIFEAGFKIKDKFSLGYAYDFELEDYRAIQGQNHEVVLGLHFGKQSEREIVRSFEEGNDAMDKEESGKKKKKKKTLQPKVKTSKDKSPKEKAPKPDKKKDKEKSKDSGSKSFDDF